jgi:hypothetical protein
MKFSKNSMFTKEFIRSKITSIAEKVEMLQTELEPA